MPESRYCVCRSTENKSFMICCDRCDEWFHGKCIGITKKFAENIDKYFCQACRCANSALQIIYVPGFEQRLPEPTKKISIKIEPQTEERKHEKKVLEKVQSTSSANQGRRRGNQKSSRAKNSIKKQCANPSCVYEARPSSKYCSDQCGLELNKIRYERYFIPKYEKYLKNPAHAQKLKRREFEKLDETKREVSQLIETLKIQKEELERNIKRIKEEATMRAQELTHSKKNNEDEDSDQSDSEDIITGDAATTFCVTCGKTIQTAQALNHWSSCHKKHEDVYNFTADAIIKHYCDDDDQPKLYCQFQDKKTKRYCMHLESACPQHSNWSSNKDEICGCPLNMMQELDFDKSGGYCLELKKECTQHYHWDKFRLAQLNMQRIQAHNKYDAIHDKLIIAQKNYEDTFGGVLGVMLHNTIDHNMKNTDTDSPTAEIDVV